MVLHTVVRDCLYLNWALPKGALPPTPAPLRYETHRHEGEEWVFLSALLFRQEGLRAGALPGLRLSYPQCNLRAYVVDGDGASAVWFRRMLVPVWVSPAARWLARMPCGVAGLRFPRPSRESEAESWRWSVRAATGGLEVAARQGPACPGVGPDLGSWDRTTDYFRRRDRGYVGAARGLRRIRTAHGAVALWPLRAEVADRGLLAGLRADGVGDWPPLHSAWLAPEIPLTFELVAARDPVLARQVPAPG
jgi:hypothetical protein